jgi:hypothetical protein
MNQTGTLSWPRSRTLTALVTLAVVLTAVAALAPPFHAQPRIAPDSITYLEANVMRTPIYPLTLRVLQRLPGGLDLLAPFQLLLFAGTCVLLAWQFARTYERPLLALILKAAVLGHPQLVSYCFAVLPEALFVSVLMVHLSFALVLARRWSAFAAAGAGASAAALALVKPSGYAAVAGLAVLALIHRAHWRQLQWLVAPAAALILAACVGNFVVRGFFATQLQGGYARVASAAPLLEPTAPTPYPVLTHRLGSATRPVGLSLHSLPTIDSFYFAFSNEYHGLEETAHREIVAEIGRERGRLVTDSSAAPNDRAVAEATDRLGATLANAAVRQHPAEYAYQVAANAYGLWWLPLIRTASGVVSLQSRLDDLIAHRPPLSPVAPAFRVLPLPAYLAVRLVLTAILSASVVAIFWTMSRSGRRSCAAYVALLLHGYILLVSLAQPGLPRYALAFWPASVLVLMATAGALSRP